jgi:hypothetical protein
MKCLALLIYLIVEHRLQLIIRLQRNSLRHLLTAVGFTSANLTYFLPEEQAKNLAMTLLYKPALSLERLLLSIIDFRFQTQAAPFMCMYIFLAYIWYICHKILPYIFHFSEIALHTWYVNDNSLLTMQMFYSNIKLLLMVLLFYASFEKNSSVIFQFCMFGDWRLAAENKY